MFVAVEDYYYYFLPCITIPAAPGVFIVRRFFWADTSFSYAKRMISGYQLSPIPI